MALFNYECDEVKRKIEEVSPNYPQLTTYEKEWLYFHKYGYLPGIPVELEYETVSVNPTGSVSNAIPFQYKSAILKGNTIKKIGLENGSYNGYLDKIPMSNRLRTTEPVNGYDVIKIDCKDGYQAFIRTVGNDSSWNQSLSITLESERPFVVLFKKNDDSVFSQSDYDNIIEYTNIAEISDNNGNELISVKMPVLTTTGKNLFNNNYTIGKFIDEMGIDSDGANIQCALTEFMPIKGGANVKFSNSITLYGVMIFEYDANKKFLAKTWADQLRKTQDNTRYYRYRAILIGGGSSSEEALKVMMMEYGTQATSYEPFKSNILTVNKDITLRSNGDVYDELNLLTGRLTQRIDENNEVLSQEVVKTVDLTPLNKPYEGVNHYHLTSNIPCEAILEVPVVSTGKQTLVEINN